MKLSQLIHKKYAAIAIFFSLLTGLDTMVIPTVVREVTDAVQTSNQMKLLVVILYGVVGFAVLQLTLYLWNDYTAKVIKHFNIELKKAIFEKGFLIEGEKNEVQTMIYNDVPMLAQNYVYAWIHMVYCIWFSFISIIYVLSISWQVALIFIVFSGVPILLPKVFEKRLSQATMIWDEENQRFVKELDEDLHTSSVVRHYQRFTYFLKRYVTSLQAREKAEYNKSHLTYFVGLMISVIAGTTALIPFGLGGYLAIQGYLTLGGLLAVFMSSDRIFGPLENAVNYWTNIKTCTPLIAKIEQYLAQEVEERTAGESLPSVNTLTFDKVSVGYSSPLYQLDAKVQSGEKILILGASGSGKSTLFKLLFQKLSPLSGQIFLQDLALDKVAKEALYQKIGYIPQDLLLYDETVAFNITLGENFSSEQVQQAIQEAGLLDFVREKGLDFQVGVGGRQVSGGEKARIVLARALIRQYDILLVDEFSSALDGQTAEKIRQLLLQNHRTMIEISHHITEQQKAQYHQIWEIDAHLRSIKVTQNKKS